MRVWVRVSIEKKYSHRQDVMIVSRQGFLKVKRIRQGEGENSVYSIPTPTFVILRIDFFRNEGMVKTELCLIFYTLL